MSQLLIIDVQKQFKVSEDVLSKILNSSKNYDNIIYLYDNLSGEEPCYDMWDKMIEEYKEGNFQPMHILTKEYGFFRNWMDRDVPDECIIEVGKFMIKNNIHDIREVYDTDLEEKHQKILDKYNIIDIEDEAFSIPELKDELNNRILNGITLAGGELNFCLKEVSLLLDILDIEYNIDISLCY